MTVLAKCRELVDSCASLILNNTVKHQRSQTSVNHIVKMQHKTISAKWYRQMSTLIKKTQSGAKQRMVRYQK